MANWCEPVVEHMQLTGNEDHSWKVKTWDKDGEPCGKIECYECDQNFSGSTKDGMTRILISNTFTNFRTKHVGSTKHIKYVARRRNKPIDSAEVRRQIEA